MESTTVQDVLNLVEDNAASNTGQSDEARKIRQINLAIEYLKRKGLLPTDEKIQSFYFNEDQLFYACADDFMEELELLYHDAALNTSDREWEYKEYSELLKRSGAPTVKNQWSFTTINGIRQLVLQGRNMYQGSILDSMEALSNWAVQGDASGIALDSLDYRVGNGSLSFAVNSVITGLAGIADASVSLDFQKLFERHAYVKLWMKPPSAAIDAVRVRLYTTGLKYWTMTATVADDGTAFVANTWQKLGFALDAAVKTSTPLITDRIIKVEIEVDLGSGFTTGTFRFDQLFTTVPDYMDLVYRSLYKGTNADGDSLKNLTAVTDIVGIGEMFPDIIDLVARRAALNLWPQLRGDKDFMLLYQQDMKELIRDVGMRFPRKRKNKYLPTKLRR